MIMKSIFKLLTFVGILSFAACEDKDGLNNVFEKPSVNNDLVLTLPAEQLSIGPDTQWTNLTFTWNQPTPPTEDYHISGYLLKIINTMDATAPAFVSDNIDASATSWGVLQRDLYKFIVANWQFYYNMPIDCQIQLMAYIDGGEFYYKPIIATVDTTIISAEIPVRHFYVIGSANPFGADALTGPEIKPIEVDAEYQSRDIVLNPNSKFVLSTISGQKYPCYMRGAKLDDSDFGYEMVYVESEEDAAAKGAVEFDSFNAYAAGAHGTANNYIFTISYNVQDLSGTVYYGRYCSYGRAPWIVGDAVNGRWEHVQMKWDYKNPEIFYHEGNFISTVGEQAIKIHLDNNWGDPSWRPVEAWANPLEDGRVTSNSSNDKKWKLPSGNDGWHRFELNNADMTIKMFPTEAPKEDPEE